MTLPTDATAVIDALGMRAHPEGGWYVETWRAPSGPDGERPDASTILYLLAAGERSHWHRVDAAEIWQWSGGEPLELRIWADGEMAVTTVRLGGDVAGGEQPQAVVPTGAWRKAMTAGMSSGWSSLHTTSRRRCPVANRRALATSGIR